MVSNTLGDDNVYILDNELFQSSDSSKPRAGVVNSWYSLLSGGDSSFETISLMAAIMLMQVILGKIMMIKMLFSFLLVIIGIQCI